MKKENRSAFAQRLIALRKKAGMRQQDVADLMQIDRTTYTKYETDVTTPDPAGLLRLATVFGMSVDYLVGREPLEDMPREGVLQDSSAPLQLDAQEQQLIVLFRQLSTEERAAVVQKLHDELHP